VVNLALGLGKTIVDGGLTWTYCPSFPKSPPPYNSVNDLLKNTQTEFWAVNMGKITAYDPTRETEYMFQHPLELAEADDTLRFLVSTYDGESDRLHPGMGQPGPRVLNFAPVLALEQPPLNGLIQSLLRCAEQALGAEVEVEFAVNLHPSKGLPARFGFLQVRPMAVSEEVVEVPLADLKGPGVLVASASVLGNGALDSIRDVVFLKPAAFAPECTPQMPAEIEGINRQLLDQRRPYLLIGFGRWGSSDPWLGVPVVWGQICGAKAIVEATLPNMSPDLSQGSHFFHNLIGFRVFYLSVPPAGNFPIDFTWLDAQPAVTETRFVKHVRTPAPLHIRVDGRSGRGVIRRE
jgi:hypothetical protein